VHNKLVLFGRDGYEAFNQQLYLISASTRYLQSRLNVSNQDLF